MDSLEFALENGCPLTDNLVRAGVEGGSLAVMEKLVSLGLPHKPYFDDPCSFSRQPIGLGHMRCLDYLVERGFPIDPGTLLKATQRGDLGYVRFLHSRGVPLWSCAVDAHASSIADDKHCALQTSHATTSADDEHCAPESSHATTIADDEHCAPLTSHATNECCKRLVGSFVLGVEPKTPHETFGETSTMKADAETLWGPLLYGWVNGAPVTPAVKEVCKAKRAATRATLLSFYVASRLSRGEGTPCEDREGISAEGREEGVFPEDRERTSPEDSEEGLSPEDRGGESPRRTERRDFPQRAERRDFPRRTERGESPRSTERADSPRRTERRASPRSTERAESPQRTER
jgi:hypothetical protein